MTGTLQGDFIVSCVPYDIIRNVITSNITFCVKPYYADEVILVCTAMVCSCHGHYENMLTTLHWPTGTDWKLIGTRHLNRSHYHANWDKQTHPNLLGLIKGPSQGIVPEFI